MSFTWFERRTREEDTVRVQTTPTATPVVVLWGRSVLVLVLSAWENALLFAMILVIQDPCVDVRTTVVVVGLLLLQWWNALLLVQVLHGPSA
jgi:hypothetical protein